MKPEFETGTDKIQVWIICGEDHQKLDTKILRRLSAGEITRARRFSSESHAAQWAFFHACLREILGACTGWAPAHLEFELGKHGKPALRATSRSPLYFNLSHSGNLALLAVTEYAPVGVDIELRRELNDMDALVKRFFSASEQAAFCSLSKPERTTAFYNIWTRKEALIKANGMGLSAPLDAFDVTPADFTGWHLPVLRAPLPAQNAYPIAHIDPAPNYVGAVAAELKRMEPGSLPGVQLHKFQPDFMNQHAL